MASGHKGRPNDPSIRMLVLLAMALLVLPVVFYEAGAPVGVAIGAACLLIVVGNWIILSPTMTYKEHTHGLYGYPCQNCLRGRCVGDPYYETTPYLRDTALPGRARDIRGAATARAASKEA